MAHIPLPEGLQGIRGPLAFRPETAKPLNELAEALLHAPNSLPQADRELIANVCLIFERLLFLPDRSWLDRRGMPGRR